MSTFDGRWHSAVASVPRSSPSRCQGQESPMSWHRISSYQDSAPWPCLGSTAVCDKARLITRTARSSIASPQARTDWGTGHAQTAQNQDSKSRGFCLSVPSVSIANQRVPVCLFLFKVKKGMCFRHSPTSSDSSQTLPAWLLRGEREVRER